mgnify:CR=1 FL=1
MENILSMLIFFPAVAATVGFLIDKDSMRQYGVVVTVVEFVLSLLLWYYFDTNVAGIQFVQSMPLIIAFGIYYLFFTRFSSKKAEFVQNKYIIHTKPIPNNKKQ